MRTLLSINNYYYARGGAEVVFLEHNRLLEATGWNVVPFSMQHPKNLPSPWSRHFIDELEFGQDYSLLQKLVRLPKVVYSFEARRKLTGLLENVRPDVAHGHNIYHHLSPSILGVLKQRGIPTVLTLHDLKIACPAYSMLAPDGICERCKGGNLHEVVKNRCIKGSAAMSTVIYAEAVLHRRLRTYETCVDRFIVPSRFYQQKLVEWGKPAEKFRHVPNFVDVERNLPDFTAGKRFVYVGRLSREKGLATLVRASAAAKLPVTLIGTGPQLDELRRMVSDLGADVVFAGYRTGDDLRNEIRAARAVVLPSEWYENAPLSLLEAYALGKPILGARIGGIPELLREGETGLGFVSADVRSLVEAMRTFAQMPDAAVEAMGRCGRDWVEREFTVARYLERVLAVYAEIGVRQDEPATIQHA